MNQFLLEAPSRLNATISLPASKSISNRALIISALARQQDAAHCADRLTHLSDCDDTTVIREAMIHMPDVIDIKAAGTAMRFMTAYLACTPSGTHTLTGTERMKQRPIRPLVDALRLLGADIAYAGEEGFPPLTITGRSIDGGTITVAGDISSQFISALILVAPTFKHGLELKLTGTIASRPYIDLTLWTMREFGAKADWASADTIAIAPAPYSLPADYYIESDWSAASYWYEALALCHDPNAEIRLEGLMDGSKQGDSSVRYIFSLLGIKTEFESRQPGRPTTITLKKRMDCVPRLDYDFTSIPDLAQTIVVTCAMLGVPFHFKGLQTLRIKETDRLFALRTELAKMGYKVEERNASELIWDGTRLPVASTPCIDTYHDHRMALAFAPTAFVAPIVINDPEVVSKSYPRFWDDLRSVAFNISNPD